jgi:hypothetical protein
VICFEPNTIIAKVFCPAGAEEDRISLAIRKAKLLLELVSRPAATPGIDPGVRNRSRKFRDA